MAFKKMFDRSAARTADPTPLPGRLIHIGPFKTGTTTVQSAFHRNREALAEHGIHYIGARLQPTQAVKAMTGVGSSGEAQQAGQRRWAELAEQARHSGARQAVISSEFLCEADDAVAERIVDSLGGRENTRVVVTLRPLASMFPSQWQQFVQSGTTHSLEDWTQAVLTHAPAPPSVALFWRRHRHDELVRRWAGIVGPENLTVIAMDPRDKSQLTREFAAMLDLPDGLLVPAAEVTNRSLTWDEAEAIRAFNAEFERLNAERRESNREPLRFTVDERLAAWRYVKRRQPEAAERKILLPAAYADQVRELAGDVVDDILAAGVRVIGDIDSLRRVPTPDELGASTETPTTIAPALAASVTTGVLKVRQEFDDE